jgi:hypothetical protein
MSRRVFVAVAIFLATSPALYSWGSGTPVTYQVEDLGKTADGFVPTVTGINASGQVSGYVNRSGSLRAVRFTAGAGWTYLPGLELLYSAATAINDNGDLTGYYFPPAMTTLHAFRYVDGTGVTMIGVLPGGTFSQGTAIAANGDIVGFGDSSLGQRAWRTGPGLGVLPTTPTALNGSTSSACGVNGAGASAGQMSGTFRVGTTDHAFRLEANGSLTDLGTLGGTTSSACPLGGIDANGRVVGQSKIGTATHAFVFAGTLTDVHTFAATFSVLESASNGVAVGMVNLTSGGKHAFMHTDAGGSIDLNTVIPTGSGWTLLDATAVNANGQIVGQGLLGTSPRAFRLTPGPAPDTTAPVIASASANPSSITPPDKRMVDVAFSAAATDDRDSSPVCTVSAVDGHGAPSADFSITGPLAGSVRATGGATYSFTVTCRDAAGNSASRPVDVVVPPDTTLPVFTSLSATPSTIWPPKGQMVTVTTSASATDDSGETPACTLGSITPVPGAAATDAVVTGANTGSVKAVGGRTYTFNETCVDGAGNGAWSSVTVTVPPDVTAPVIGTLTATPSSVTPPNGAMVAVTLSVSATDDVDDAPSCALASITSVGAASGDFAVTGPFSASVRAVGGRTYSLTVKCSDTAGNPATRSVDVVVPPDTTAPVVTSLTATPAVVWPPNGALVVVTVAVTATDDSEQAPACALSGITASSTTADDYAVTGQYSAMVRAVGGRTYSLRVTCADAAGNRRDASVNVYVTPDTTAPVIEALSATPDHIWPPDNKMTSVTLSVAATDDVDAAPTCSLTSITGAPAAYFAVTGPFSANLRAEKDVVYTLNVTCGDKAGNKSQASVPVAVSKDSPVAAAASKK